MFEMPNVSLQPCSFITKGNQENTCRRRERFCYVSDEDKTPIDYPANETNPPDLGTIVENCVFDCGFCSAALSLASTSPSNSPTLIASLAPSVLPTNEPSMLPSHSPSMTPTTLPNVLPSMSPSIIPSDQPSSSPSNKPTVIPSGFHHYFQLKNLVKILLIILAMYPVSPQVSNQVVWCS